MYEVKAITNAFQSTARMATAMSKSFRIELPGEDFTTSNSVVKEQLETYPRSLRFHVLCPAQAGLIAIYIYSLFSRLVKNSENPGLRIASDNLVWMLNGIAILWDSLSAWEGLHKLVESLGPLKRRILEALCNSLDDWNQSRIKPMSTGNAAMLALRCTVEILDQGILRLDQAMEACLASGILTLLETARRLPSLSQLLTKHLCPLVSAIMDREKDWTVLQQDFQVFLTLWHLVCRTNLR